MFSDVVFVPFIKLAELHVFGRREEDSKLHVCELLHPIEVIRELFRIKGGGRWIHVNLPIEHCPLLEAEIQLLEVVMKVVFTLSRFIGYASKPKEIEAVLVDCSTLPMPFDGNIVTDTFRQFVDDRLHRLFILRGYDCIIHCQNGKSSRTGMAGS